MKTPSNTQKLYKGNLQTIILELLHNNDRMYGYEITQKVKELTQNELQITEGALYPALHKLEADGYVDIELVKIKNRKRKYYKLTENGLVEKDSRIEELKRFIANMQNIMNLEIKLV